MENIKKDKGNNKSRITDLVRNIVDNLNITKITNIKLSF